MKLIVLGVLLLGSAAPGATQELVGRVERAGRGLAGVAVTLHRVTSDSSGAVAETRTDSGGVFRIATPPAAPTGFTVLFSTAEWQGIRYFGPALHATDARTTYRIEVFDTIAARPNDSVLRVARRDLILLPEASGGWEVNEVLRVENTSRRTLVSSGGLPTWEFRIPAGTAAFEVGEGGIPADQIQRMGTRVLITASLPPGTHDAVVRYRIPPDRSAFNLEIQQTTGELGLLVREPSPRLRVEGMTRVGSEQLAGERFARYNKSGAPPGTRIRVEWDGQSAPPISPVLAAAVVAGLVLAGGTGFALRNPAARR